VPPAAQELGNRFEAESRGSADGLAAITARWPLLLDMEVPQELQAALQAQQAECELVLSRKGAIIEAARNILRAQDDEFVATLSAQAEVGAQLGRMLGSPAPRGRPLSAAAAAGRGHAAGLRDQPDAGDGAELRDGVGARHGRAAAGLPGPGRRASATLAVARMASPLTSTAVQARQSAASAAAADLEAALEARGASEQAYVDQVLAKAEETRGLLREQRGVDAEEYKALKSRRARPRPAPADAAWWRRAGGGAPRRAAPADRLEEQLHALEADYGILRATYQANTEKLVYNCRVLAERAQESAATLSQQKRRLSRQRDVLSGIKVRPAASMRAAPGPAAVRGPTARCACAQQRYAHAERKCAEDNLRTTEDYRRTLQAFAGLQDKFRRFQDADTAKRTAVRPAARLARRAARARPAANAADPGPQVLSMKTAELGLLEEQLLDALRTVHEQQLGWAWSAAPVSALAAARASGRHAALAPRSCDAVQLAGGAVIWADTRPLEAAGPRAGAVDAAAGGPACVGPPLGRAVCARMLGPRPPPRSASQ